MEEERRIEAEQARIVAEAEAGAQDEHSQLRRAKAAEAANRAKQMAAALLGAAVRCLGCVPGLPAGGPPLDPSWGPGEARVRKMQFEK
eukprot:4246793-Prymnesium_polylepis.1